jgi:hypothetical protein
MLSIEVALQVPLIPLDEVLTRAGTVAPIQIDCVVPKLKEGVRIGLTVTINVTGKAQIAPDGVKVYTPDAWSLTTAGFQVPLTPLTEVNGSVGTVPPAHIVSVLPKPKLGIVFGVTETVNVAVVAHWPAAGVNV